MRVRVGVANFFLDQSIGTDETNIFQLKFVICPRQGGATVS